MQVLKALEVINDAVEWSPQCEHFSHDDHCEGRAGLVFQRRKLSQRRQRRSRRRRSAVESAPKHETVHEVTFARTAAVPRDIYSQMKEVEASTKTANETMKDADTTTETGEHENVSEVGVVAARRHEQFGGAQDHLFAGCDRTRRWTCWVFARARERAEKDSFNDSRLHQTFRQVNQYSHVCVEKCR